MFLIIIFAIFGFRIAAAQETTDSLDPVRERVKEKIENILKNPKAYYGTITDKTDETLQIKNTKGEIQFISVDPENTSFVNVGKTTSSLKFDDVGLGDFVIALGFQKTDSIKQNNGSTVLEASRILVTEEVEPTKRKIVFGNVVKIEKKILTLNSNNQEVQFEFPKTWKGPEINEVSEGDHIAVVSIPQEEKVVIRTIEVLNSPTPTPEE